MRQDGVAEFISASLNRLTIKKRNKYAQHSEKTLLRGRGIYGRIGRVLSYAAESQGVTDTTDRRLGADFCSAKETSRPHNNGDVEDVGAKIGRKRCAASALLNGSVLPSSTSDGRSSIS